MIVFFSAVATALVVSFMCSIFESVLLSLGHARVEALARDGRRSGALLRDFKRNIDVPIAAILIVNTVAHTIGAAVAGATYSDAFSAETLWVFTIVFTTAVLLFTEIVPKTLGVTHANALASPVAYGIHGLTLALKPLVALAERISKALRSSSAPPVTSVEELRLLAALGRSEGVVGVRTASIIMGATRLSQLRADDIMVPRQGVHFLSAERSLQENLAVARESGHSRLPLSSSSELDNLMGIVLIKELLFHLEDHRDEPVDWTALAREPLVVPASKPLNALLRTFDRSRMHLAVVVDDYGEIKGIVTLEDVLEEIVGEIDDELDTPDDLAWEQADGTLRVPAMAEVRRVCERLGIDWDPETEAATLGGLITDLLGRVPEAGDTVVWNGFALRVASATPKRAELIVIERT